MDMVLRPKEPSSSSGPQLHLAPFSPVVANPKAEPLPLEDHPRASQVMSGPKSPPPKADRLDFDLVLDPISRQYRIVKLDGSYCIAGAINQDVQLAQENGIVFLTYPATGAMLRADKFAARAKWYPPEPSRPASVTLHVPVAPIAKAAPQEQGAPPTSSPPELMQLFSTLVASKNIDPEKLAALLKASSTQRRGEVFDLWPPLSSEMHRTGGWRIPRGYDCEGTCGLLLHS